MATSHEWTQLTEDLLYDYWWVGIFVHILGNLVSSTKWCIAPSLHSSNKTTCMLLLLYYFGNALNKLSYALAPIALLLPLQTLLIVFHTLFQSKRASHTNDISKAQVIGIIVIFAGLALSIIFGPRSTTLYYTIEHLLFRFNESSSLFIMLILTAFVLINWIILQLSCKYKTHEFYMLSYIHLAAYFGAWNIVLMKCILQLISSSLISAHYAYLNWTHWLSYVFVICFIFSFVGVEHWKQRAFDHYHAEYVIAIYTFLLVTIGILLGSSMLFDEFTQMTFWQLIIYFVAILVSFIGVGIVSFSNLATTHTNRRKVLQSRDALSEHEQPHSHVHIDDNGIHHYHNINALRHYNSMYVEGDEFSGRQHQRGMIQWNENQLDWQTIGQILMDHDFIDTVEATNATLDHLEDFCEEEDILYDEFRDALCASYCSVNDEGTILWSVLSATLNFTKERRARFYDLLLHEYFSLTDMSVTNICTIVSKMMRELNVPLSQFTKIKEIILNKKLDGFTFENYSNSEFVKLFRSIREVDAEIWYIVYEELMYWSFQEFANHNDIQWEMVGSVLWENNFMQDQDELNLCLDALELFFDQEKLGADTLQREICRAYGNKTDKDSMLREVLLSTMHYPKQIRAQFYDILLHKYLDLENLNCDELIAVLKRTVHKIDETIDYDEMQSILRYRSFTGKDLSAIRNAEHFAAIFRSIKCVQSTTWEQIYEAEIAKWQQTPTEYEHSQERDRQNSEIVLKTPFTPQTPQTPHLLRMSPVFLRPSSAKERNVKMFASAETEQSDQEDEVQEELHQDGKPENDIDGTQKQEVAMVNMNNSKSKASTPRSLKTQSMLSPKRKHEYLMIDKDHSKEEEESHEVKLDQNNNEIADALICILEDVALSNHPYKPSKRSSNTRHHSKQRRISNAEANTKVFPRERRQRRISNASRKSSEDSDANILSVLGSDLRNLDRELKYIIETGEYYKQRQLLSFIVDSFDLVRVNKLIASSTELSVSQFVKSYRPFKNVEAHIIKRHRLQGKYKHSGDFIAKTFAQYYMLFGHQIVWNPSIKIMDSLGAFMCYTFAMSNAIEEYIRATPQTCPFVIDLWIIPNKAVSNAGKHILNDIGDIDYRLKQNNFRYIKKTCNSNDITKTARSLQECLCSANIRHGLKHKNVNRVIFIVDRRYQDTDYLYCYIPPSKYSKLFDSISTQQTFNDTLHICHTYHTSRYLLPSSSTQMKNCIGASDKCNGYMFALSFVIYKHRLRRQTTTANATDHTFKSKIYFYAQGGKIRFLPSQITTLWPRYFVQDTNKHRNVSHMNKFVRKLFELPVDDPYFERSSDLQKCVFSEIEKQFTLSTNGEDANEKKEDFANISFADQLKEWMVYKKTHCQSTIIGGRKLHHESEPESKQAVPSETSDITTPTATQISPMTHMMSTSRPTQSKQSDELKLQPVDSIDEHTSSCSQEIQHTEP